MPDSIDRAQRVTNEHAATDLHRQAAMLRDLARQLTDRASDLEYLAKKVRSGLPF